MHSIARDPPPQKERKDNMNEAQIEVNKRIRKEFLKLRKIFKKIDEDTFKIYDGLLNRAAFMRITLEDYEKDINENGSVEMFSQGNQEPYERARPVMQFYNTTNKNYQSIIKQLTDLLPRDEKETTLKEIVDGLQKPQ